jgi:hypothetical protein
MTWKLYTRSGATPASKDWEEHDNKDAALERACDIIRRPLHAKVLHIEEPDGTLIGLDKIGAWCNAHPK